MTLTDTVGCPIDAGFSNVLRGVMDEDWLAAANRAIEATLEDQPNLPEGHPATIEV